MQRYLFEIDKGTLVVTDKVGGGSLRIIFKPLHKPTVSPALEAQNDLELALASGKLHLGLFGINTITERKGFKLEGQVVLSRSHLHDCEIRNGNLHMVSFKQKTLISESTLRFMGSNRFGVIAFKDCYFKTNPEQGYFKRNTSYFKNDLMIGN
ncbi:hypothetical protein D5W64_13330 [Salmonella enterica subsp. enterica serovar Saintpaul]|nr:hypothetical protein [Salmonella enterica subsp. enterica serovar Saintpaul]